MTRKFNPYKLQVLEENDVNAGAESGTCGCSCYYANSGGADTCDNGCANAENDIYLANGQNHIYHKRIIYTLK